ncbi:MAG TPA: hypothetical protein VEW48_19365 [Thermoanaerobaculia bacterium]|nr:hypothetical protein [Thermoanaerobaculia bacterium]
MEEVFQIPAQVLFILRGEAEGELSGGRPAGAVAFEGDLYPVAALRQGVLLDAEL